MSGTETVLVFLDDHLPEGRLTPADQPHLSALDLGVTRGDGVFESLLAQEGRPRKLGAHLDRLASSARMLDLPVPGPGSWQAAIEHGLRAFGKPQAIVRLLATRGLEQPGGELRPNCWVQISPVPPSGQQQREAGIDVLFLDRGYDSKVAERAPWLLLGAKTLSYAVNMAALRYARQHGAHDVIFHSSDGRVLEGPTSSVLVAHRGTGNDRKKLITPLLDSGILPGTTQGALFAAAEQHGWQLGYGPLVPQDLLTASAVWLVSSIRGVAPVRSIDGRKIATDATLTTELSELFEQIP